MADAVRARSRWIQLYRETGDAGLVCRRCGVSRPTLRKWLRRHTELGDAGLESRSRRPLRSPKRKVLAEHEAWIIALRRERKLGARRIQAELRRLRSFNLSLATIHKVLKRHSVGPLVRLRRHAEPKRYSRPIPGERVQVDTMKVAPGLIQYTAVDDCTRCRVLALFPRRSAEHTLEFFDQLVEEMPFPVQRIQSDRGTEFFAVKVQRWLQSRCIKFRPVKPASPHLNGKVERSQKTDLDEFYTTTDLKDPGLADRLAEWQHFYNWFRPHGSLGGKTPMDRFFEVIRDTPFWDDVVADYHPHEERIREANYSLDLRLARLKRSR
jgi:transposase InsO family protein